MCFAVFAGSDRCVQASETRVASETFHSHVFCHRVDQITQEIVENEIEKKADVLCILFNPDEPESLVFAEDQFKKLAPQSIPRVVIAYKSSGTPDGTAVESSSSLATEAVLKQFPASFLCDDKGKVQEAISLIVRTALRPCVPKLRFVRRLYKMSVQGLTILFLPRCGVYGIQTDECTEQARQSGADHHGAWSVRGGWAQCGWCCLCATRSHGPLVPRGASGARTFEVGNVISSKMKRQGWQSGDPDCKRRNGRNNARRAWQACSM